MPRLRALVAKNSQASLMFGAALLILGSCTIRSRTPTLSPIGEVSLVNVRNNQVIKTELLLGLGDEYVKEVGCRFDGGTMQIAQGTTSWSCSFPRDILWGLGTRHSVKVGPIEDGEFLGNVVAIEVVRGPSHDINGDGYADTIVGAPDASGGGVAYVYEGGQNGLSTSPTQTVTAPSGVLSFGSLIGMGDLNSDGYADVVVKFSTGLAVYYGTDSGLPSTPERTIPNGGAMVFGGALALGDVQRDGYDDIVVSQFGGTGGFHVFKGGSGTVSATPTQSFTGPASNMMGLGIAIGDVNRDAFNDVVISSTPNSGGQPYSFSIYNGGSTGVSTTASGPFAGPLGYYFGTFGAFPIAVWDMNSDTYPDVIVAAMPQVSSSVGAVHIYQGSATGIPSTASQIISGVADNRFHGTSVATGDLNGDGYPDLVVGASTYSAGTRNAIHVYNGTSSGTTSTPSVTLLDPLSVAPGTAQFGCFDMISDFDGDGYADLLAGAADFNGGGPVYLYGGAAGVLSSSPSGTITSPGTNDRFGAVIAK